MSEDEAAAEVNWQAIAEERERLLRAQGDLLRQANERLAAAEQVCVIFGWTGLDDGSDESRAVAQAWHDWAGAYGSISPTREWRTKVKKLARRRDEIRSATLAKLRAGGSE
jgi:hypothetical protein